MFARRSRGGTRWALGTVGLAALAGCVVGCGGDSSSVANPILDGSLGGKDSAAQEPSNEAGGDDSTVGDETPAGDDAPNGVVGDDSGSQDAGGDAGDAGAPGDSGSAPGDAGDAGSAADAGGDAGTVADSGGVDSSAPADAGASDGGGVGTIPCGTATCMASSQVCCYGATATPSCVATGACTGTTIDCRNTANCQGGDICCLTARGGALEAACAASASCTGVRLCADGDCPANETCTRGLCLPNGPALDGGFPLFDGGFPGFDGGFLGFDGGFGFPAH